jgi:hypothetical protein
VIAAEGSQAMGTVQAIAMGYGVPVA